MAVVLEGIRQSYARGTQSLQVLRGVSLSVQRGECVFLAGPSGSGKSSLLSVIGCLLTPEAGRLTVLGQDVAHLSPKARARFRLERIGFLFQRFHLIRGLTAIENAMVPLVLRGEPWPTAKVRAARVLKDLGMSQDADTDPRRLSVGQCQRVALARALAADPDLILADEPTASLDWSNGRVVIQLLRVLAQEQGKTVIGVTHDQRILPYCDRVLYLEDGIVHEHRSEMPPPAALLQEALS
jgi:putative ABC transport system ATP-binding protein